MILLLACGTSPTPTTTPTPTAATAETASTPTGHTGLPPIDTGWALDPGCADPVELPVDIVQHQVLYQYPAGSMDHCNHLVGASIETEADLAAKLGAISGARPWDGTIDWSTQQALLIGMQGCKQGPELTIERLRHCDDGRVVIDAERPGMAVDHPTQQYWVAAVPADTYTGFPSRVRVCDGDGPCANYEDGELIE